MTEISSSKKHKRTHFVIRDDDATVYSRHATFDDAVAFLGFAPEMDDDWVIVEEPAPWWWLSIKQSRRSGHTPRIIKWMLAPIVILLMVAGRFVIQ